MKSLNLYHLSFNPDLEGTCVEMKLVSEVRIFKRNALGRMKVHPFNDPNIDESGEKYYVEPNIVKYMITKQY